MRITIQHVFTLASAALFYGVAVGQDSTPSQSSPETQLKSGDVRASHLLGAMVKRLTGDSVGEVKDLIVSADKDVRLAVISVGGVLGVGDKMIALPFNQFQVAPDGATLYLSLSEEELSARPAFDLENVTADSRSTADEPAASAQQTFAPGASSPGFVPSNTEPEDFVNESDQPAELASPPPADEAQTEQAEQAQLAERQAEQAQQAELAAQQQAEQARVAEQARLAEQAQLEQQAREAEQVRQAEQAHQAALAQLSEQAQLDHQARQALAASKTKASNQPASALIGKDVVDPQNFAVGKVNDIVVTAEPPEVQVIVQLSEELGSGAKLVAVPLPELTISQGGADDTREIERVETELTVAQLEALPQFQY